MENDNRNVFAKNLQYQMDLNRKTRKDISEALGISYYTVSDWVSGKKYPRMDKVELLANYFRILKSDLIEEKGTDNHHSPEEQKLTEGEEVLLNLFRQIPVEKQEAVLEMIRLVLKTQA